MGIPEKGLNDMSDIDSSMIYQAYTNGRYAGYVLRKDFDSVYKTRKLIGQNKPKFTLVLHMIVHEANQFPQGVGKVTTTKLYKLANRRFMVTFTVLKSEVEGKGVNDYIPVEVRFTEL